MAITFQPSTYSGLVDRENGMVSREIFVNPDIYAEEQDRIFTRAWLFVGHESQVAKPGDFFVSSMGEESVILCRDRQGEIHVFLNSCMHRGMKVCRYDEGNTRFLPAPITGGASPLMALWWASPSTRTRTTRNWTSPNGA